MVLRYATSENLSVVFILPFQTTIPTLNLTRIHPFTVRNLSLFAPQRFHPELVEITLSLNNEFDRSAYEASLKWERSSNATGRTNKRLSQERPIELPTGQELDMIANQKGIMNITIDTKLTLPSASPLTVNCVITYNSFIVDVAGDGDCGYHSICRASLAYGKTTATGLPYLKTAWETRQTLLAYLRAERINIERAAVDHVNETQGDRNIASIVRHLFWRDVSFASVSAEGTHPLFEEYCDALCRGGIGGK